MNFNLENCALYRHYDADGILLYIGITHHRKAREGWHRVAARWSRFSVRREEQVYPGWDTARLAEKAAIKKELPVFNIAHAEGDQKEREAAYLIKALQAA